MQSPVELIKSKLSIVDVVGSFIKLEKAGSNYRARCPFHNERTPSFFVSPGRNSFHCFGCAKGGDIFTFVEEIEGVDFREALKLLADRAGVNLESGQGGHSTSSKTARLRELLVESVKFYSLGLKKNTKALEYLSDRGIKKETMESWQLGCSPNEWHVLLDYLKAKKFSESEIEDAGLSIRSPKGNYYDRFRGRIMFPFFDFSGRPIGFSARVMPGADDKQGTYINSPETSLFHKSNIFYGLERAKHSIRENDSAILVEGQIDVIMAHQAGTNNVIGVSGTALTIEHLQMLKRLTDNLIIVLDSDLAGFKASERAVGLALATGFYVSVVALSSGDDPASSIQKNPESWQKALQDSKPFVKYAIEIISNRGDTDKDKHSLVREHLYYHIAKMYNDIDKDKVIQEVAALLSVSPDAIRSDLQKWLALSPTSGSELAAGEVKERSPSIELVCRHLLGIAGMLDSRGESVRAREIQEKIREHLNPDGIVTDDVIFEAEAYYPAERNLEKEVSTLFDRLFLELRRQNFSFAINRLREAETIGDKKAVAEWLAKCQQISRGMIR